ncbi:MAG: proline--tRNA ligase [Spirochaetaceae bacterium]|nr:MAG: proline--tRNA ligase [Spirochaetaceae bacterium]
MAERITPRAENYSQWYVDTIIQSKLADYAPVKGCMVIRPRGFALWEKMKAGLDNLFKETGHQNAYFPMLIPDSFLKKEAEHVEGFSPELAVVTHAGGEQLEEPLILRPTSETIIWSMYKKWIQSYRDLPLLINQWANVIRWEKRTRLFLRTTEFLWQEGHTAHATAEEAQEETLKMLMVYKKFAEEYMALPVIAGIKSESEKFAGAVQTYAIEGLMQDKRALQAGTSHNLGQNFAKAFDVTFQTKDGTLDYVWATSWGVSTRLVGALIMTHSDDRGLVLPPVLAPVQVMIVPIFKNENKAEVIGYARKLFERLKNQVAVQIDEDDQNSPGWKFAEAELQGIPIRIEVGPKDMEKGQALLVRRDTHKKIPVPISEAETRVKQLLEEIQNSLYHRALTFRKENTHQAQDYQSFKQLIEEQGGFVESSWCGNSECETKIKEETKATIRVLPMGRNQLPDKSCILCGEKATELAVFAKAY